MSSTDNIADNIADNSTHGGADTQITCRLLFVFDFTIAIAKLGSNLTGLKGVCGLCFQNFRSLAESAAQSLEGIGRASTAMRCLANSMTGRCASAEHAFETAMKTSNKK